VALAGRLRLQRRRRVAAGWLNEMGRIDASFRQFFGVHSGLAMSPSTTVDRKSKTEMASTDGSHGEDRMLRSDRPLVVREQEAACETAKREATLDYQRQKNGSARPLVRHLDHLGARPCRQSGQGIHRGEKTTLALRSKNSEQDCT